MGVDTPEAGRNPLGPPYQRFQPWEMCRGIREWIGLQGDQTSQS